MATPPESPREAKLRSRVIWSFWVVIVLLGLPTWWTTTSIYRASLPTDFMLASHDELWYSIPICLQSAIMPPSNLTSLAKHVEQLARGPQGLFKFRIQAEQQCPPSQTATIINIGFGYGNSFEYVPQRSLFDARFTKEHIATAPAGLAAQLQTLFLEENAAIGYALFQNGKNSDALQSFVQSMPQDAAVEIQRSANRAFKPTSEYHLTFSLFTAGPAPSSWNVRPMLIKYIQPILYALSSTSNITVTSQVQLYSSFSPSVQPQQIENGWQLKQQDLTSFVNTAEWPLSPSIGSGPTINFIVYIPTQKQIPLHLEGSPSNSWLVPQWGGISICNPPLLEKEESELGLKVLPAHLEGQQLEKAFENFQSQLLQLLGVPQSAKLPLPERLKSFQRLSGLSLYLRTYSSLGSLARLAQHLSSIPIPRHVLGYVENSLERLSTFRQCFDDATSSSWTICLQSAREAFIDAEKAFFDRSMVGQVYFPDEHKVAVYLPLLGPIGVPLLVGLLKELKVMAGRKR